MSHLHSSFLSNEEDVIGSLKSFAFCMCCASHISENWNSHVTTITKHQNDKQQVQQGNATWLTSLANAFQLKKWAGNFHSCKFILECIDILIESN